MLKMIKIVVYTISEDGDVGDEVGELRNGKLFLH